MASALVSGSVDTCGRGYAGRVQDELLVVWSSLFEGAEFAGASEGDGGVTVVSTALPLPLELCTANALTASVLDKY